MSRKLELCDEWLMDLNGIFHTKKADNTIRCICCNVIVGGYFGVTKECYALFKNCAGHTHLDNICVDCKRDEKIKKIIKYDR